MTIIRTLTLLVAAVLVGTLGVSGMTYALWSSQATASSSVSAGAVGVTLTGGSSLTVTYSSTTLSKSGELVVTNSGTVASNYATAVTLASGSSAALASAVQVAVWPKASSCPATPPSTAATGTWAAVPAITGSLSVGATATWCVRTSVTTSQVTANPGTQVTPTFTTTAMIGSWTATAATSTSQNIAAAITPATPTLQCTQPNEYNVIVSWPNVAGWDGNTRYQIWVKGASSTYSLLVGDLNGWQNVRHVSWPELAQAGASPLPGPAQIQIRHVLPGGGTQTIAERTVVTYYGLSNSTTDTNKKMIRCE